MGILYLSSHLLCLHSPMSLTPMSLTLKPTQRQVYLAKWSLLSSYLPCKVLTVVENIKTAHNIQERAESYSQTETVCVCVCVCVRERERESLQSAGP